MQSLAFGVPVDLETCLIELPANHVIAAILSTDMDALAIDDALRGKA
jgi:hypothetical protein